ncbi:hypothetical protein [Streptomyces murinus]|uniref:hypothetical protein n=1 Tax=Streptomyces murinus TaxID=33900 RepID=UPI003D67C64F
MISGTPNRGRRSPKRAGGAGAVPVRGKYISSLTKGWWPSVPSGRTAATSGEASPARDSTGTPAYSTTCWPSASASSWPSASAPSGSATGPRCRKRTQERADGRTVSHSRVTSARVTGGPPGLPRTTVRMSGWLGSRSTRRRPLSAAGWSCGLRTHTPQGAGSAMPWPLVVQGRSKVENSQRGLGNRRESRSAERPGRNRSQPAPWSLGMNRPPPSVGSTAPSGASTSRPSRSAIRCAARRASWGVLRPKTRRRLSPRPASSRATASAEPSSDP